MNLIRVLEYKRNLTKYLILNSSQKTAYEKPSCSKFNPIRIAEHQ